MNKILWVFGPTASGKNTFMNNAINDNRALRELLKIEDENLIVMPIHVNTHNTMTRYNVFRNLYRMVDNRNKYDIEKNSLVVLIHGQHSDVLNNTVQRLQIDFPEYFDEFLCIDIEKGEHERRIKSRELETNTKIDISDIIRIHNRFSDKIDSIFKRKIIIK